MSEHGPRTPNGERQEVGVAFLGRYRWFGRSVGMGTIRFSPDRVFVSVGTERTNLASVVLRRNEITRVTVERWRWGRYVRFEHSRPGVARVVLFRGGPIEPLLSELRAMGYPVG